MSANANSISLVYFDHTVNTLRAAMKRQYDRAVNRDLSQQKRQGLFRRNVTSVLRQTYQDALLELQPLVHAGAGLVTEGLAIQEGTDEVGIQVLNAFDGMIEELIYYALQKHRTSCALSNFPQEHNPSKDTIADVIQEASRDWMAFKLQVDSMLASQG